MEGLCSRCVVLRNVPEGLNNAMIQTFLNGNSEKGYCNQYVDLHKEDGKTWIVLFKDGKG